MIITRDQVKTQLGLSDSTYDTQIDAKLPMIDAKVKIITGRKFNAQFTGTLDNGGNTISALSSKEQVYPLGVGNPWTQDHGAELLEVGDMVTGDGIPTGAYITDIYMHDKDGFTAPLITVSETLTAGGSVEFVAGFNIGYHDIVAKGVWYLIEGTTNSTAGMSAGVSSKSIGPVRISYGSGLDQLDGRSGMPLWFVQGLSGLMVHTGA